MSTLVQSYFERDLSPAEDEALEAELRDDPAAADRLAELAELDYRALGLPYPPQPPSRFSKKAWALGGLGVLAGVWLLSSGGSPVPELISQAEAPLKEVPAEARAGQPLPPAAVPVLSVSAVAPLGFAIRLQPLPQGQLRARIIHAGQGWSLDLAQSGPGAWGWNGRLSTGVLAPAGRYRIELSSGEQKWQRWVEIKHR